MSDPTAVRPDAPARVLYRGGSVYSPADPFATAVLVEGPTVAWVGSDEAADAQASRARADGEPLAVVDLDGALVTPAFVDAHVHTTETGLAMAGLDLTGARSAADVLERVARSAAERPGEPVLGHGWDETGWPEGRPPTAAELERAAGGAEVYLSRVDVHSALVSPALAARAGLAQAGRVERDAHHAARDAVHGQLRADPGWRRQLQARALRAAAAVGIGSVHECSAPHVGSAEDLRDLVSLSGAAAQGLLSGGAAEVLGDVQALPEVLALWGELVPDLASAKALVAHLDLPQGALLGLGGDLCVDGALGSRTALLREPYADLPAGAEAPRGRGYLEVEALRDHVLACTRAGLQAGVHAIGDAGLDLALEAFSAAADVLAGEGAPPLAASRHRLEHAVAVDAAGIATMARLGLVASVQPAFDAAWGGPDGVYAARLGRERALALHPFGPLAAAGVPLALGSDSPVTPFAPWEAVRAAAFPHVREHAVSARAAFLASTRGGWRAARRDGEGALVPGAAATLAVWEPSDLVVQAPDDRFQAWSTDARSGTPGLPDLTPGTPAPRCLRTLVRGRTAHDAGDLA